MAAVDPYQPVAISQEEIRKASMRTLLSTVSLVILFAAGCERQELLSEEDRAWIGHFDPIDYAGVFESELPQSSYSIVRDRRQDDALAKLKENSIQQITTEEASSLAIALNDDGRFYYLIRSCYFNDNQSNKLYFDGQLLVHTNSNLSRNDIPMQRSAIVVTLDQEPTEYRFGCSLAE